MFHYLTELQSLIHVIIIYMDINERTYNIIPDTDMYIDRNDVSKGIILGIDFGLKRIGLAICDSEHNIATPLMCLDNLGFKQTSQALDNIYIQHPFKYILIGWPLNMNNTEGPQCNLVHNFCCKLYAHFYNRQIKLGIIKWDERLSSRHTEYLNQPKKGKHIDHIVATGLLQEYLNYLQFQKEFQETT